jgi:hypothetical protein
MLEALKGLCKYGKEGMPHNLIYWAELHSTALAVEI